MIKRYYESYEYESGMYEADDGEWVKWEDVNWLFKSQLNKLEFKDGDIIVLNIDKYHEQYQKQIYDSMKNFLINMGYPNSGLLLLTQPMDVGVLSTHKSKEE